VGENASAIILPGGGPIRVAPVGTAAPADESAVPGVGWLDLGYAHEDGVHWIVGADFGETGAWQTVLPVRRSKIKAPAKFTLALLQWDKVTLPLAYGGGTFSVVTAGHYKFTPPGPEAVDYRAFMVDFSDGDFDYRCIIPKGLQTGEVDAELVRGSPGSLPISFDVIQPDAGDPYVWLSNNPAWNPS
jgi:hypothetical protein